MLSGDWIPPTLPQTIHWMAPNATIESLGGATEAAIWSVHHEIVHEDAKAASIPYGVPLVNQSLHVLDCRLSPRPDNVEGALYIGGAGLAQGYLGQAEMTANAFVTHPISGQRLYRTGDLAKYREDGEVILIGREDAQVKIQGLRVELGDVTQALLGVPEVEQVRVDAIGAKFENKRLVAFATPRVNIATLQSDIPVPSNPNLIAALRSAVEAQLPAYLRPHDYIIVDSFPVTGNGKIDRIALARLAEQAIKQRTETEVKASTELELALLEKCREVLELDHVDLTTEFYAMGADSLRLVELASVIEETFEVELGVAEVFEYPTIHAIAELIMSRRP
jgi:nonribosomal peptide synthetase protein BlmIV